MGRELILLSVFLPLFLSSTAHPALALGNILFQRSWGGGGTDIASGVAVDSSGNVYVTGRTNSFGSGGYDTFILKFDPSGNLIWQRTWGGRGDDWGLTVALDTSLNVYVSGLTNSFGAGGDDAFILKFDSAGTLLWQRTWGGNGTDIGYAVSVNSLGEIYLAGSTNSYGAGNDDVFLLKLNATGSLEWEGTWGGSPSDEGYALSLDSSGNIYVTGTTFSFGNGLSSAILLKFNSTGSLVWQKTWGDAGYNVGTGVSADPSGNVYVTGSTTGSGAGGSDIFLLKFDSLGNLLQQETWGGSGDDSASGIALDPSGNIYVTGDTTSLSGGGARIILLKFNPSGGLQQLTLGSIEVAQGSGVATDALSNALVAGTVFGPPPYCLDSPSYSLRFPSFSAGTPAFQLASPPFPLTSSNGTVLTPDGSLSYAGGGDVLLFEYGSGVIPPVTIGCGSSRTCSVLSNYAVSNFSFSGDKIQFDASGAPGAKGYANVTIPKAAVPSVSQLRILVNQTRLPDSARVITMNTTHFSVYFTFPLQGCIAIDIILAQPQVSTLPFLTMLSTAFTVTGVVTVWRRFRRERPSP